MPRTQAYHAGYSAFEAGLTLKDNPHQYPTRNYSEWNSGYRLAHDEFVYDDIVENEASNEFLSFVNIHPPRFSD